MKCRMCGRTLTDPESKRRGFGPVCWAEMHPKKPPLNEENGSEIIQIPGQIELKDWLGEQDGKIGEEITQQKGTAQVFDTEL